ncbi:MAG: hypothetical protein RR235_04955 [Oscillospiraceae bacterium]
MNDNFNKTYRYMKGVYEAKFFGDDGSLQYYDNKLTEANFETNVNLGEITAGVGNPTVIQLPDSAKFNVKMTAADVELRSRQLQTGGELGYNGITDTTEIITPTAATLTLGGTPCAPYGSTRVLCFINGGGSPYTVDPVTKQVANFAAVAGTKYTVKYYVSKPGNEVLNIHTLFAPVIGRLEVKKPVFSAPAGANGVYGTHVGNWHIIAPRFQFGGDAGVNTSQTSPATTSLSGQALGADNEDDGSGEVKSTLVYMVYEPLNTTEGVKDLVVLGGGNIALSLTAGASKIIPLRYVMADGGLAVPLYSKLTFTSAAPATAAVTALGAVSPVAVGSTEISINDAESGLKASCNIEVKA